MYFYTIFFLCVVFKCQYFLSYSRKKLILGVPHRSVRIFLLLVLYSVLLDNDHNCFLFLEIGYRYDHILVVSVYNMADRRKVIGVQSDTAHDTDRQFMDRNGVNGLLKELLTKIISNRPDDPIKFIANYFESLTLEDPSNDLINRAVQQLSLTHHSRPVFENNVKAAFQILGKYKISKRLHGVNGTIHSQLLHNLCQHIPSAVTIRLLKRLECADHEAITYDVFRSSVFTCCVLNDFSVMAGNLFMTLDMQKTGKADKNLCESTLDQLRAALGSSRKDVKRIMESSYNLAPEGLYLALDRAMSRRQTAGFYTHDQFVSEACEAFLAKVKKLK